MSARGRRKIATDTFMKIYAEGGQIPAWNIQPVEFKYGIYIGGSCIRVCDNQRRKWVISQQAWIFQKTSSGIHPNYQPVKRINPHVDDVSKVLSEM
jgi:hypothetical protein